MNSCGFGINAFYSDMDIKEDLNNYRHPAYKGE